MLSTGARVGHAPSVVRRPALAAGFVVTLLLGISGCGSEDGGDKPDKPSKAAVECREKWKKLESEVDGRDSGTTPSGLAQRWTTISATADYYSGSARAKDCGDTIQDQEKAIEALGAFSTKLAPYDMEARLAQVESGAEEYAAAPRPTPPAPSPVKGKKTKKAPRNTAPRPVAVAAALKVLTQQAPVASQQQRPAWQQASVVELSDPAAVAKAVKDLAFLSSESPAHRACTAALATIQAAALASLAD